ANNLCDYEQDLRNNRFTIVHYIGPKGGIFLYTILSIVPWIMWILYAVFGFLPLWILLGLILVLPFGKNLVRFRKIQIK
ncbi:1,4-dihydroxy-2-naphthoate prenyltransferase, partial [Streptococcus pyogenes]